MSAVHQQLEKVVQDSQKDAGHHQHPNDPHTCNDHGSETSQSDMSLELLRIAAAAAEEAIEKVLGASSPSKVGRDIVDVDSDDGGSHLDLSAKCNHPMPSQTKPDAPAPAPARKVSECEPEDSVSEKFTSNSSSQETMSVSSSDNIVGDIENRALGNMTASVSRDMWLYKRIYHLMKENVEIWRVLSDGNASITDEEGSMMMFSQVYARVEVSSTSESSLVQIVPTPVHFRMYGLDRDVPERFRGFVFAQARTKEGYISRYGISASTYNTCNGVRASDNPSRPSLLHDFALHLTKINRCLVEARDHYVEATRWNDFAGNAVIKWAGKFPKSRMSSNFFIRRNIGVDDVIAFIQILTPRKPSVVEDALSYQKVA